MKTEPDALDTVKNQSESAKYENGTPRPLYRRKRFRERKTLKLDLTPSVLPKTSPGAQNMTMGPDSHGSAESEFGSTKYENRTRRPRNRRKRDRERKK
jgi:hypothetical protein